MNALQVGEDMTLTTELESKIEALSEDNYNRVVMIVDSLSDSRSDLICALAEERERHLRDSNTMTMQEIDDEIQRYCKEKWG